jgi:hypothetical protein
MEFNEIMLTQQYDNPNLPKNISVDEYTNQSQEYLMKWKNKFGILLPGCRSVCKMMEAYGGNLTLNDAKLVAISVGRYSHLILCICLTITL